MSRKVNKKAAEVKEKGRNSLKYVRNVTAWILGISQIASEVLDEYFKDKEESSEEFDEQEEEEERDA